MVYTIRKTIEVLDDGGVPYRWRGIAWVQGLGDVSKWDNDRTGENENWDGLWEKFGVDTSRVWLGFKAYMGLSEEEQQLVAVLDQGGMANNQLLSGKSHAIDLMPGCQGLRVEASRGCEEDWVTCKTTSNIICNATQGVHTNPEIFNYYGWDPNIPNEMKPDNFSLKEFLWFAEYPVNQHAAAEGQIMNGWDLANGYIDSFTTYELPVEYRDNLYTRFPARACDAQENCSATNFCYVEKRTNPGCKQPLANPNPSPAVSTSPSTSPSPVRSTPPSPSSSVGTITPSASVGITPSAYSSTESSQSVSVSPPEEEEDDDNGPNHASSTSPSTMISMMLCAGVLSLLSAFTL